MKKIKFSHNWNNKLNCDMFTTIRKYTESKASYYKSSINENFEIDLGGEIIRERKLIKVINKKFYKIPPILVSLDVGMPYLGCKKVFKNFGIEDYTECLILVFN